MTPSPTPSAQTPTAELRAACLSGRISGLDLRLMRGRCVVLVGPNGAGKSSVLRALLGLVKLNSGQALLDGVPLDGLSHHQRASTWAWLPQRPHLSPDLTLGELAQRARFRFDESPARARARVQPILEELGISALANRPVSQVSGGELQRALLAALVAQEAPLLAVDEPANHLDPAFQLDTYRRLGRLWQEGRGLCVVTHDIRLCQVLGPAEQIEVVGLKNHASVFRCTLASEELPQLLARLYGVEFLPLGGPAALAVSLAEGGRSLDG